jgi:hypothetical protein
MSPVDPKQGLSVWEMVVVVQWKILAWAESVFLSLAKIEMETSPQLQQWAWFAQEPSEAHAVFQWAVVFLRPVVLLSQPELSWVMVWAGVMVELGPWRCVLCRGLIWY